MTPQEAIEKLRTWASYSLSSEDTAQANELAKMVEALESLASAAVTVLPIETAPKNGSEFMAFRPKRGWMKTKWDAQPYNKKPVPYFYSHQIGTTDSRDCPATHWCLFPDPTEPKP